MMLRLNLQLSRCWGQCYDGGSNIAGCKSGVKAQILKQEPQALFTHCYGHSLSLSVVDTIITVKYLGSTMVMVHKLSKLLQYSPKHLALFKGIKAETSPDDVGFCVLCPTLWIPKDLRQLQYLAGIVGDSFEWQTWLWNKSTSEWYWQPNENIWPLFWSIPSLQCAQSHW